jgi:hypothetical protein
MDNPCEPRFGSHMVHLNSLDEGERDGGYTSPATVDLDIASLSPSVAQMLFAKLSDIGL